MIEIGDEKGKLYEGAYGIPIRWSTPLDEDGNEINLTGLTAKLVLVLGTKRMQKDCVVSQEDKTIIYTLAEDDLDAPGVLQGQFILNRDSQELPAEEFEKKVHKRL